MTHTTDHLTTIATRWADLRQLLTTTTSTTWPPAQGYGRTTVTDLTPAEQRAATRADEHDILGDRPVPLRLDVLDTMTAIETLLLALTDQIASEIQRQPAGRAPCGGWTEEETERRDQLAARDAADPRRWRYRGHRTAADAALWLAARLAGGDGPFLPLGPRREGEIARAAVEAARMMAGVLGDSVTATVLDRPCPWCTGTLTLTHGGGGADTVVCGTGASCSAPTHLVDGRRTWGGPEHLAGLEVAMRAAARRAWERDRKRVQRARTKAA